ncbi:MAG: hypothetical protein O3C54_05325 [Proteobacteria bacterium]|nr:hypothetical protein [Pseudomonadota bacterium]MDA1056630.1 hypothetical protein [Pseudomonadota bacterium]
MSKELTRLIFVEFDKHERLQAFHTVKDSIRKPKQYWALFSGIWSNSESIYQNNHIIADVLTKEALAKKEHLHMMDKTERKKFDALPDILTIYRGCWQENRQGFSWTLDKKTALWFANRIETGNSPILLSGKVTKDKVFALLLGRNENEIVTLYEYVYQIKEKKLPAKKANVESLVYQAVHAGTFFSEESEEEARRFVIKNMVQNLDKNAINKLFDKSISLLSKYGFSEKVEILQKDKAFALNLYKNNP